MKCSRCKWSNNREGINCIGYFGPSDANIVFIGEAYGRTEAMAELEGKGQAFIGVAGEELNKLLKIAGIDRKNVAIMNAMRCYQKGNPTPTKKDLDACFFNTYNDIRKIDPDLVVAMGGPAIYQTTGLDGVERNRGKVVESQKLNGRRVFMTYHPASVKYDESKYNMIRTDFKNLRNAIDDKPFEIVHYPYIYIDTYSKFEEMYEDLLGKEIKFDIETTGLDPFRDSVTLIQMASVSKKIYVVDMRIINNKSKVIDLFKSLMKECPVVGQGFDFDAMFVAIQYNAFPEKWSFDTCLGEYSISGLKGNDLDFLTDTYAPESSGYSDDVKRAGGAHKVMDKNKLLQYASDDIGVLFRISRKQRRTLMKRKSMWNNGYTADWCYKNLTLPANKVLTKMSIRGLPYDIGKLEALDEKYAKKARRALMKAHILEGVKETEKHFRQQFNPRSDLHVKWMMLEYYKLPVLAQTAKDNPSIGKNEMKIYAKEHDNEYAKLMEKYRSIQGIRDNFLGGVISKLYDGVAHTDFSLHGTASGRPISKNPNILNIPDVDEIRECCIARPGYVFLYSDLSQIEVREAAVIYNEPELIKYCNTEGKDFHCLTTSRMFKIDYDEVLKWYEEYEEGSKDKRAIDMHNKRSIAKTITFGILYQMGAEKLAYRLGITIQQAEKFIETYFAGFPQLAENIERVKDFVNKNGFIDTWFGFRRHWQFYGEKEHKTQREAVNHPIQGTAWNIEEKIMIEIDDYIEQQKMESYLCWQNYDSITVMAKEEEVDELAPKMKEIMENIQADIPVLNRVKIKADIKKGYDLGHFEKLL